MSVKFVTRRETAAGGRSLLKLFSNNFCGCFVALKKKFFHSLFWKAPSRRWAAPSRPVTIVGNGGRAQG
jgi:hypothetical protein